MDRNGEERHDGSILSQYDDVDDNVECAHTGKWKMYKIIIKMQAVSKTEAEKLVWMDKFCCVVAPPRIKILFAAQYILVETRCSMLCMLVC